MRFLLMVSVLLLGACAKFSQDPTKDWTAERFYQEAHDAVTHKNWAEAVKHFETLEARYPYGVYSEQAQLELAYAYYKDNESASAIAAADRFIRLHPTSRNVDYAYYIKGLANIHEQGGVVGWLRGGNDLTDRDPKNTREAYDTFRELATRFPESRYAKEARTRMVELVAKLAKYEIDVARYYYMRGAYVAAANRAKYVVEHYQRTPLVEDALGIQAQSYAALGLDKLKSDTVRVLQKNYPHSRYLEELKS